MKSISEEEAKLNTELKEMMADLVVTDLADQKLLDDLKGVLDYE